MDMLMTGYTAASVSPYIAPYQNVQDVLTQMPVKVTFEELFLKWIERWSQALEVLSALIQWVLNSKRFAHFMVIFAKKRINNTME